MANNNVSVIIPAYNARETIVDCVESTLSSVVKPLEVIVVLSRGIPITYGYCAHLPMEGQPWGVT